MASSSSCFPYWCFLVSSQEQRRYHPERLPSDSMHYFSANRFYFRHHTEDSRGSGCNAFQQVCCVVPRVLPQQVGSILGPEIPVDLLARIVELDERNLTTKTANADGATPLHLACEVGSVQTVRNLLSIRPELSRQMALEKDARGLTPLDVVWLRQNPGYVMYDSTRSQELCVPSQQDVTLWWSLDTITCFAQYHEGDFVGGAHQDNDVKNTWEKTLLLVSALQGAKSPTSIVWTVILSKDPIPSIALWFALKLHGEQARWADSSENLPLHYAACNRTQTTRYNLSPYIDRDFFGEDLSNEEFEDIQWSMEEIVKECERSPVSLLTKHYPNGVNCRNKDGRLPIHLAVESGTSWKNHVEPMLTVCRDLVNEVDPVTSLLPFMLAAVNLKEEDSPVDAVYELLKANPAHLQSGCMMLPPESAMNLSPKKARWDRSLDCDNAPRYVHGDSTF